VGVAGIEPATPAV